MNSKLWVLLLLAGVGGFILGTCLNMTNSVRIKPIRPIRTDIDEIKNFLEENLSDQSLQYLEGLHFPENYHPFTKKIELGSMLLAGNDDFTNYCLALKRKDGKIQLITTCDVDDKNVFFRYYAPDVNLIHCPEEFGVANETCTIMQKQPESTRSFFYTRKGHTYVDSDDDGVWDLMSIEDENGDEKTYLRDGFSWKPLEDNAENQDEFMLPEEA